MTDTFSYHPPGLSPNRYNSSIPPPPPPSHASSPSANVPLTHSHSPLFSHSRPSSSAGPYGLAALQEHPQDVEGEDGPDRPKLVGFDQLSGQQPSDSLGALADLTKNGASGGGGYVGGGGDSLRGAPTFSNPFQRPLSPQTNPSSTLPGSATFPSFASVPPSSLNGTSHHAFYNPHPTVNARNTRPMTAPSGPGYFHNSAGYSAAPSAFYAPQHSAGVYDHIGSSTGFQYHLDTSHGAPQYRPTTGDPSQPIDPRSSFSSASADDGSPTSSTPFFYAPPSSSSGIGTSQMNIAGSTRTPSGSYYPTSILDPSNSTGHPATSLSLTRPTTAESLVGPSPSTRRRSSTGSGKQYNFVQQAGQSTKRPRRRFDEIERLYNCDYPGCTKSYGTLNHLNSHKTMQKHGPKSTPAQFKEMRKAWRERKKAEAAAAARERATEPPNPATLPTTTDPLGGPNGIMPILPGNDRPRPSTSAGEYHFSMPAPFMAPPSIGGPSAFHAPAPPTSLPNAYASETNYQSHYPSPLNTAFNDPYSSRPVTAPSHFFPPVFGQPLSTSSQNGTTQHSPQTFHSPTFNLPQSSPRFSNNHDRRFSLPAPSLQQHFASPEVKMPQPILGYNPSALLNGSNGGNALGFGVGLNGKMSMNGASNGGAAEDGTFGAIKEDIEGEEPISH